jgi:bacteriocin-like protein
MTKEISRKGQESLVKTSAEGSVELSEQELQQVAGGQKNKVSGQHKANDTSDYLVVTLTDASVMNAS